MDTIDHFRGAMIGLAIGDAFGASIAGAGDPYHAPVVLQPTLTYGHGVHLALDVARATLAAFELDRDPERLGLAVAGQLVLAHEAHDGDPSTRAAVERLLAGRPWRDCGDPRARPPVVALRAVPLGLACAPSEAGRLAIASTLVTHHGATALEAAFFVARTISRLVRGTAFDRALVDDGRKHVEDLGLHGNLVAALDDALRVHAALEGRPLQWLVPADISPGDGGLHAESAVGLAVLGALLAGRGSTEASLELAARIHGDGRSVAALTGAFLGAARGMVAVPMPLVEALDGLEVLVGLADALHDEGPLPDGDVHDSPDPRLEPLLLWRRAPRGERADAEYEDADAVERAAEESHEAIRQVLENVPKLTARQKYVMEGGAVDRKSLLEAWSQLHR